MEFWSTYRVLRRRRWLIGGAMLVAIAVAIVVSRPGVGDYEAVATLSIPSEQRAFFVFGGSDQLGADIRTALALNLLRSRDLAERVVQRFHLGSRPEDLQRRIRLEKDPGGRLMRVIVTGRTPAEAVTLTNAVADTAAAYDQEVQSRESTLAREFIEKQVEASRTNLRNVEEALLRFKQRNEFVLASAAGAQVSALEAEGQRVALSLNEIEARLASLRAQMDQQSATRSDQEITDNPIAQQLRAQLVNLEVALTSELAIHTENYPSVIALKSKIQAVKDRLNSELSKIVSAEKVQHNPIYDALAQQRITLETDKVALLAKTEALRRALGAAQRELPGLAQIQMEQSRLARNTNILEKEDADLQTRLAQSRLREQGTLDLGSLAVVDHARGGRPASFQSKLARLLLAAVLGLLGGGSLAYFQEYLDNALKTPENAERLLGVPVLVAIPRHNPPFAEAYRVLQANLAARHGEGGAADVIAVTSPRPRAGTSTVVSNLARAFACSGWRTLVIDAGLQRPTQHLAFGIPNTKGLVEILAGEAAVPEAFVETDVPNLWVLPSGAAPVRMNGFLSSLALARLLADLKCRFDVILVDTPPVGAFADALTIAPLASGVLLVLDARQTPRGVEERVKVQLDRVGAKLFGSVLTKVRPDLVDSYVYQELYYHEHGRRSLALVAAATFGLTLIAGSLMAITRIALPVGQSRGWTTVAHTVAQWMSMLPRL